MARTATVFTVTSILLHVAHRAGAQNDPTGGCIVPAAGTGTAGYTGDGGAASLAQFNNPSGVAFLNDGTGSYAITDRLNNVVRLVSGATGQISRLAGNSSISGYSGDGSPALGARFSAPYASVMDSATGVLYISDAGNNVIRSVFRGIVTTVAGTGTRGFNGDGVATNVSLSNPAGMALDIANGRSLLFADTNNHCIRRFIPSNATVVTVAGSCGTGGVGGDGNSSARALLNLPRSVAPALDAGGGFFIADYGNSRVRRVNANGIISTVAGNGSASSTFFSDFGAATSTSVSPNAVAVDSAGGLLIVDNLSNRLRRVGPAGFISTVAGFGVSTSTGNGGPSSAAALATPVALDIDGSGGWYVVESNLVRRLLPPQQCNAVGIFTGCSNATAANITCTFSNLAPILLNVTLAGSPCIVTLSAYSSGNGTSTVSCPLPVSALVTSALIVWSHSLGGGNATVSLIFGGGVVSSTTPTASPSVSLTPTPTSTASASAAPINSSFPSSFCIHTIAGTGPGSGSGTSSAGPAPNSGPGTSMTLNQPTAVVSDGAGGFLIADANAAAVRRLQPSGILVVVAGIPGFGGYSGDGGNATNATLKYPMGVTLDGVGGFFIADTLNANVRRVNSAGIITTVAGNKNGQAGDGILATTARLSAPASIALDGAGGFFIADFSGNTIRRVNAAGIITTVAGNGTAGFSGDGIAAISAMLNGPRFIAADPAGGIVFTDVINSAVRRVNVNGTISTLVGTGVAAYTPDGPAKNLRLNQSVGVTPDGFGGYIITETGANIIRRLFSGAVTTIAGTATRAGNTGDYGPALAGNVRLTSPYAIAPDGAFGFVFADIDAAVVRRLMPAQLCNLQGVLAGCVNASGSAISCTVVNIPPVTFMLGQLMWQGGNSSCNVTLLPPLPTSSAQLLCAVPPFSTTATMIWYLPTSQNPIQTQLPLPLVAPSTTPSATATLSMTSTATASSTSTLSTTSTGSATATATSTGSATWSTGASGSTTSTRSVTSSATGTMTLTSTGSSSGTATSSGTSSSTSTSSATWSTGASGSTTSTSSVTATGSSSSTSSSTSTVTRSSSATGSSTGTGSSSMTATGTSSVTSSSTSTSSVTSTSSATWSTGASGSVTSTRSVTSSATGTMTLTSSATGTSSSTGSTTGSATGTSSVTSTGSATWSTGASSSVTSTASLTSSTTSTPTSTSSQSSSMTTTGSATSSVTSTGSATWSTGASASVTSTRSVTATGSATGSSTSTGSATGTSSVTATSSATWSTGASPSVTSTSSLTASSTATQSVTSSSTSSATATGSATSTSSATGSSTSTWSNGASASVSLTSTASVSASTTATQTLSPSSNGSGGNGSAAANATMASSATPSTARNGSASAVANATASMTSITNATSGSSATASAAASMLPSSTSSSTANNGFVTVAAGGSATPSVSARTQYYPNVRLTLNVYAFMPQGATPLTIPGSNVNLRSTTAALCALRLAIASLLGLSVSDVRLAVPSSSGSSMTVLTSDCNSMAAALSNGSYRALTRSAPSLRSLASACGTASPGPLSACVASTAAMPSPPPPAANASALNPTQVIVMIPAANGSLLTSSSMCNSLALSSGAPGSTPASSYALSSLKNAAGVTMLLSVPSDQSVAGCTSSVISDLTLLDPSQAPVTTTTAAAATGPASNAALIGGAATAGVVAIILIIAAVAYFLSRGRNQGAERGSMKVMSSGAVTVVSAGRLSTPGAGSMPMRVGEEAKDTRNNAAYVNPLLQAQAAAAHHERHSTGPGVYNAQNGGDVSGNGSVTVASPTQRTGFAPQQRKRVDHSMRVVSNVGV